MNDNKSTSGSYSSLKGIHRAIPIILFGVAVFCTLCFLISDIGDFGRAIRSLLFGLFANGAYFIPLLICLHAVFYPSDLADKRIVSRLIFSFVSLIMISSFCYTIEYWNSDAAFNIANYYTLGKEGVGGGAIGSTVAYVTVKIFGSVGLIVIALTILAIYISYFFASGKRTWSSVFMAILKGIVICCAFVERMIKKLVKSIKDKRRNKKEEKQNRLNRELSDDEFFDVDNGMQSLSIDKLGIAQSKIIDGQTVTLHDKVFHKSSIPADEYFTAKDEAEISKGSSESEDVQKQFTPKKRVVHTDFDMGDDFLRSSTEGVLKNNKADIIIEEVEEPKATQNVSFSYEKSADDVFTKDFDPFKLMMSDDLANKPSSKATSQGRVIQGFTYSEKLNELTEEDVERAKRVKEFEARKQMIINQAKQATPVKNNGEYSGVTKSVEFRESTATPITDTVKEDSSTISLKIDKNLGEQTSDVSRAASSYEIDRADIVYRDTYVKSTPDNTTAQQGYTAPYENEPAKVVSTNAGIGGYSSGTSYGVRPSTEGYGERPSAQSYDERPKIVDYPHTESAVVNEYDYSAPITQSEPPLTYPCENGFSNEPTNENADTLVKKSSEGLVFEFGEDKNDTTSGSGAESLFDDEYSADAEEDSRGEAIADSTVNPPHTESIDIERTIITDAEPYDDTPFDESDAFDSFTDATDDDEEADDEYIDEADDKSTDEGDDEYSYSDLDEQVDDEIGEDTPYEATEIPENEQNDDVKGYRNMFNFLRKEDADSENDSDGSLGNDTDTDSVDSVNGDDVTEAEEYASDENDTSKYCEDEGVSENPASYDDAPPFDTDDTDEYDDAPAVSASAYSAPSEIADLVEDEIPEEPKKKKADYSNFRFPPIELLGLEEEMDDDEIAEEINENTKILIETLQSFNVTASIKGVDRGPRITRYEVVPAKGVKVNQITHLFDDIALNLAAEGIRMEAPIPGKSAIGFEIPNKRSSNVRLRELLECEKFINATSTTFVCIGKDVAGTPVFADIEKFPHCLVAGATGMGKSVCINSILISLLYKARPDEVKFIMIDPKKVEFKMYSGIPHLLIPVITDAKQAAGALMWAVEEMERRYDLIESINVRNLGMYNERVEENPSIGEKLPKIIIVIDELNDLMMQVREPCEDLIMRIAQKARAAGIHLIIGTQRPDAKVITGTIKANINTRIACKVGSQIDSRTILDNKGAEKLLNKGDMLYKPVDKTKPIRVQGAFVSDAEVESIMAFLKAEDYGEQYDSDVINEISKAAQKCGNKKSQSSSYDDDGYDDEEIGYYNDQKFLDAVELAIRSGKISTSLLQRKLSIGYGKAAKYIDAMEEIGVVSEPNGPKPREVLITIDEWHEKLSRVGFDD